MNIRKANISDIPLIRSLAERIWAESYRDILSAEQIRYMLQDMYSTEALSMQMNEGANFVMPEDGATPFGFASFSPDLHRTGILRIHKLYLLKEAQGKGAGKALLAYISNEARNGNCSVIELNVNRSNPAYYFYLKEGFKVTEEVNIPYRKFVLDDYVMQKEI